MHNVFLTIYIGVLGATGGEPCGQWPGCPPHHSLPLPLLHSPPPHPAHAPRPGQVLAHLTRPHKPQQAPPGPDRLLPPPPHRRRQRSRILYYAWSWGACPWRRGLCLEHPRSWTTQYVSLFSFAECVVVQPSLQISNFLAKQEVLSLLNRRFFLACSISLLSRK